MSGTDRTAPYIGIDNCNTAEVTLWWDLDFSGDELCFSGNGLVNLTDYAPSWYTSILCHCFSWDDQSSSFALDGCALSESSSPNPISPGIFTTDTWDEGQVQYFKWNVSKSWRNFNGLNGILPNDSLSTVDIECSNGMAR